MTDLARGINAASAAALAAEISSQAALRETDALPSPAPPSPTAGVEPPESSRDEPGLQLLQTLEGHTDRVWAVAWSPDGSMLASCSGDKHVRIWTRKLAADAAGVAAAGQWVCTSLLEEQSRTVRALAWSPNSRCLASGSFDATTAIWEVQGGVWEMVATLEGHENEVKGVAWACNGSLLATCSRDRSVWIWESLPGHEFECVDVKQGHSQDVKAVRWHPHGEILVSASYDDSIKLWADSGDDWDCVQTLSGPGLGHSSTVWDVAFNGAGTRMVSCSDDKTLKLWSCCGSPGRPRWKLLSTVEGAHERTIFSVDWSPAAGGAIATGSGDNAIRVFVDNTTPPEGAARGADVAEDEGTVAMPLEGVDSSAVARVGEGREAAAAAVSSEGEPAEGQVGSPTQCGLSQVAVREGAHRGDVNCVRWHPSDRTLLVSAGDDGTVRLWRLTLPLEL